MTHTSTAADIAPDTRVIERLADMSDEQIMRRWQDILDIVRDELTYLNHQRQVMQAATDVYNGNPRLLKHQGRQFFTYVRDWYGAAMATGYRRQTDQNGDSASLRVLLEELLARPSAYSIETLRPYSGVATDETIRFFALRVVGADETGTLDIEIVKQDIRDLVACGTKVKHFVNKVLAHTDMEFRKNNAVGPSFNDIHSAQKECERIAKRWIAAFSGPSYSFDVVEQFGWLDIFDIPWRVKRPHDAEDVKRYIVSLRRILDEAELDAYYDGAPADVREAQSRAEMTQIVSDAAALDVGDATTSLTVLPHIVRVERII